MEEILRLLKLICRLLTSLDREESTVKPAEYARVYGPGELVKLQVFVSVWPIYPDYEDYKPGSVLRGKAERLKLASQLEDDISMLLVGYKVKVRIEIRTD